MKILDPVHKYIYFSKDEKSLIDSLTFQRLRGIKQLGFTERTFIGATHNRLTHSLGSCYLAGRAFENIFNLSSPLSEKKKKEFYKLIRVAALLHDIGHGPLSHSSESKMPLVKDLDLPFSDNLSRKSTHVDYSILLILQDEISKLLESMGIDPQWVISLFQKTSENDEDFFKEKEVSYKPLLEQIIHSEIDVDRMDYLKRDSYFCGTYYGSLDFEWILKNLAFCIDGDQAFLALKSPALYTAEDFLLAHHHMRLMVYWHPKNTIYDEMLNQYFKHPQCQFFFPTQAQEYIFCADSMLYDCLKRDSQNVEWAKRIIYNNPYKHVFQIQYTLNNRKSFQEKFENMTHVLENHSISFISKKLSSHIAQTFNKKLEHKIYVVDSHLKKSKPLEECVRVFEEHDRTMYIDRIYVDSSDYKKSKQIIEDFYKGDD